MQKRSLHEIASRNVNRNERKFVHVVIKFNIRKIGLSHARSFIMVLINGWIIYFWRSFTPQKKFRYYAALTWTNWLWSISASYKYRNQVLSIYTRYTVIVRLSWAYVYKYIHDLCECAILTARSIIQLLEREKEREKNSSLNPNSNLKWTTHHNR